ncbi:probable serine/threonine-protein kinase irlF [Anastrepha ludens]|uniref:probable serine/threonine-protein kinase irlF n=1 Tax=Anastrepha ludens TaxID=28586 RepID=UPI0023B1C7AE|nr:probable serine/threonine-protein kinase irlF [Anastrepha ludens]
MIETKILQFLALATFMLICSDAYYPYGQQQHHNRHGNYNNHNGNFDRYNNINNNNNNNNINNRRNTGTSHPLLAINLPKVYLGDFEYVPTRDGYRFSYELIDGTRRTEVGYIPNTVPYMSDKRATEERTALRMRARANAKNRKLSPKSLQSLAG